MIERGKEYGGEGQLPMLSPPYSIEKLPKRRNTLCRINNKDFL
jgi:hypothetical protein